MAQEKTESEKTPEITPEFVYIGDSFIELNHASIILIDEIKQLLKLIHDPSISEPKNVTKQDHPASDDIPSLQKTTWVIGMRINLEVYAQNVKRLQEIKNLLKKLV